MTRHILLLLVLAAASRSAAVAQSDDGDTLRLSPSFRRQLDAAFSLDVKPADVPRANELTREQLHEWVDGEADGTARGAQADTTSKYTREYFQLKCYLADFAALKEPPVLNIPGLTDGGWRENSGGVGRAVERYLNIGAVGIDANHALSMAMSPRYRRVVRSQRLADSRRAAMDTVLPILDDTPLRSADKIGDRSAITSLPWWAERLSRLR